MEYIIKFAPGLTEADTAVLSDKVLSLLDEVALKTGNRPITITSTLRPIAKQAQVMYDNLVRGVRIRYAEPGRQVVAVYDHCAKMKFGKQDTISRMADKIRALAAEGKLVSRHCVTKDHYDKCNIIDISTKMRDPKSFISVLAANQEVVRIISPYYIESANAATILHDPNEQAIHVEIRCSNLTTIKITQAPKR